MYSDYELEKYYRPDNMRVCLSDYDCTESFRAAYEELEYIELCELEVN